jgi:hypothetical protein
MSSRDVFARPPPTGPHRLSRVAAGLGFFDYLALLLEPARREVEAGASALRSCVGPATLVSREAEDPHAWTDTRTSGSSDST